MASGCISITQSQIYESKLNYSIDNIPPFYDSVKVLADFKKNFYSKQNFDNWKKGVGKTSLVFENFSNTKIVNGYIIKKPEEQQLAIIKPGKPLKNPFIAIKTNQLNVLEDFFKYSYFISEYLNKQYVNRAKDEAQNSGITL